MKRNLSPERFCVVSLSSENSVSDSLGPLTRQISSDVPGIRFHYHLKISSYPKNDKAIHEKVQRMLQSKCSAPPPPTLTFVIVPYLFSLSDLSQVSGKNRYVKNAVVHVIIVEPVTLQK